MNHENEFICCKCNEPLVLQKVNFSYLGREFSYDMLKCPVCGLVFIPESIVNDKMLCVEQALEGK